MSTRRRGRGRLSSIDLLPDHAREAVAEALQLLAEKSMTQESIREALNAKLAGLDPPVDPISSSAFNRYSMRFSAQAGKLAEAREAAAAMAEKMDDLPEGDIGLLANETIKTLINDIVMDGFLTGESPSISLLKEASLALGRLEQGRLANARTKKIAEGFVKKAADAVEEFAKERGLSADVVQAMRAKVMGVER